MQHMKARHSKARPFVGTCKSGQERTPTIECGLEGALLRRNRPGRLKAHGSCGNCHKAQHFSEFFRCQECHAHRDCRSAAQEMMSLATTDPWQPSSDASTWGAPPMCGTQGSWRLCQAQQCLEVSPPVLCSHFIDQMSKLALVWGQGRHLQDAPFRTPWRLFDGI